MTTSLTQSIGARDSVDTTTLLYQGAYNRSADGGGLDYWVSRLESGQLGVDGLAASIVGSPEFIALHNGQDLTHIVNSFYVNVLGRTADQAGLDYWVNSGQSVGNILLSIALSPESSLHNDAALHGYESAVSSNALPVGAPPLETFAVPDLTVQTHSPLDPQFLNANGDLFFGDGTTPADGFSTVVDPGNSGLLFRRRGDAPAGRYRGRQPDVGIYTAKLNV